MSDFECPDCGAEFDGPRHLSGHIIREHRLPDPDPGSLSEDEERERSERPR